MTTFIRLLPGLLAAIAAFVGLKLIGVLGLGLAVDLLIFLVVYLVVAVVAHRALKSYGKQS